MTLFWIGLALGIAGTLADYLTTRQALAQSGTRELNPVSRWLMEKTGTIWVPAILVDVLALGGMGVLLFRAAPYLAGVFLGVAGWIQLVAAYHNREVAQRAAARR